jgi:nucleotidyltransferase/DNA polymerase involved in DNA repair
MNSTEELKRHRLPCGPATVAIDGVCRKRLRDHFDSLLDRLTQETHPEGADADTEDLEDEHEMQEEAKKARQAAENTVKQDLDSFEKELKEITSHENLEDKKSRLVEEGKMKADVKYEIQKYSDKLMGNSKMLQDPSGKLPKK